MFKTVLAHLSGTGSDKSVLATALELVRPFAGHIECLRVIPEPDALVGQAAFIDIGSGMVLSNSLNTLEQTSRDATERARFAVAEFRESMGVPNADTPPGPNHCSAAWREKLAADETDCVTSLARFHDAVVLAGGPARLGCLPSDLIGSIIVGSGRPVVLAPEKPRPGKIKTVAIAWKDSAEAARALGAAMPLLVTAENIEVLTAPEEDSEANRCLDCSESVVQQLRWHGLEARNHFILPAGRAIPDAILDEAHRLNADLLVMGAYGHSRLREFVFGGFTRRILQGIDLPVFLFH